MVSLEPGKSSHSHLHLIAFETGATISTLNISQLFELIVFILFVMVMAVTILLNTSSSF